MKRASLFVALTLGGCWESGTAEPPPAVIPSPLADAGGRFRVDAGAPPAAEPAGGDSRPTLLRHQTVFATKEVFDVELPVLARGNTLVVAVVDTQSPDFVVLGSAALREDALVERNALVGTVWSLELGASRSQRLTLRWNEHVPRGVVVWMEWAGLGRALTNVKTQTDELPIRTATLSGMQRGTLLLAVALARPNVGATSEPFMSIATADNDDFGIALGSTIADGSSTYRATFATDPTTSEWTSVFIAYRAAARP